MIKRLTIVVFAIVLAIGGLHAQKKKGLGGLLNKAKSALTGEDSNGNVGMALKEALNEGTNGAVDFLSAEDGYYKSIYKVLLLRKSKRLPIS